jgi:energy-coupling factor transporter ATP-binding protein EcfA2
MDSFRRRPSFEEPFNWWGPVWKLPAPIPLQELIALDELSFDAAALLGVLIEGRHSVIIAAGPSGAGKTTLLNALLEFLPEETRRIYLRGCYEPFDFLSTAEPATSALLVNEISPHLPIYLWGPGVRRALGCVRDGYQLFATAHATSLDELIYSLAGYPLRIPLDEIAGLGVVVLLDVWIEAGEIRRQVSSISLLRPEARGGLTPEALASRASRREPLMLADLDALFGPSFRADLERRKADLERE